MRGEGREKRKRGRREGDKRQKGEEKGERERGRREIEEEARGEITKKIRRVGLGRGERREGKGEIKEEFRDADDSNVTYAIDCNTPAHGGVTASSYICTTHTMLDNCAYSNSTLVPPNSLIHTIMFTLHWTHPLCTYARHTH